MTEGTISTFDQLRDLLVVVHWQARKLELLCDNLSDPDLWAMQDICGFFTEDLLREWGRICEKRRQRAGTAGAPS